MKTNRGRRTLLTVLFLTTTLLAGCQFSSSGGGLGIGICNFVGDKPSGILFGCKKN